MRPNLAAMTAATLPVLLHPGANQTDRAIH